MPCLDEDTITDLLAGRVRLDAPEVEEHLASCPACARLIGMMAAELAPAPGSGDGDPTARLPAAATVRLPARSELLPGAVLNHTYIVLRPIGKGGMGEVYEVRHVRLAGRYAVKLLRADVSADEELLTRFRREAEITSALRHPGIVQVIDFDRTPDGHFFLAMEYMDGCDLAALLKREGPLALPRALAFLRQIASALGAAHRRGIVHRDLKPGNVFVVRDGHGEDEERVKLMDFGLSKWSRAALEASLAHSQDRALIGTPLYMAPEQARGQNREVTPATDQFALAAIFYEMLTGAPPFSGATLAEVLYAITFARPAPLGAKRPDLPRGLGAVIERALAKEQADRFPSVQELVRAIELACDPERPAPAPERRRLLAGLGAAALVGAGGVLVWRLRRARTDVSLTRAVESAPAPTPPPAAQPAPVVAQPAAVVAQPTAVAAPPPAPEAPRARPAAARSARSGRRTQPAPVPANPPAPPPATPDAGAAPGKQRVVPRDLIETL